MAGYVQSQELLINFGIGRHQLSVVICQLCLGRNRKETVIKGSGYYWIPSYSSQT